MGPQCEGSESGKLFFEAGEKVKRETTPVGGKKGKWGEKRGKLREMKISALVEKQGFGSGWVINFSVAIGKRKQRSTILFGK